MKFQNSIVQKEEEADLRDVDIGLRASSRCSMPYFLEIIKTVRKCPHMMKLVDEMGFQELLLLDDCNVPRGFSQRIADKCSFGEDNTIIIHKTIVLNATSVQDTFAIPSGDIQVDADDEEEGKLAFLGTFALTGLPSIKYFGNMITNDKLPDKVFKRCFMVVALGTFLCPTSSTKPSTKYLGALVDVDSIGDLNWCKFVHDWLLCYIRKYHKDKLKGNRMSVTLGGCIYHLAVSLFFFFLCCLL